MPTRTKPARRRGRVDVSTIPAERERHLKVAHRRLALGWPIDVIALKFRISVRTVHLWIKRALGYDDPRAAELRGLAGR